MSLYVMFFLGLPCLFGFQPAFFAGLVSRCVSCRHVSRREVDHFPTAMKPSKLPGFPKCHGRGVAVVIRRELQQQPMEKLQGSAAFGKGGAF